MSAGTGLSYTLTQKSLGGVGVRNSWTPRLKVTILLGPLSTGFKRSQVPVHTTVEGDRAPASSGLTGRLLKGSSLPLCTSSLRPAKVAQLRSQAASPDPPSLCPAFFPKDHSEGGHQKV